jgi:integrase
MSNRKPTRTPQGIRVRHSRSCRSRDGASCNCRPAWEASVYLKRERKKLRKTFPTLAAAKSWRADAIVAANRGRLRPPTTTTVRQAAATLLAGIRDGSIPTTGGRRYKPATIRGYEVSLRKRVLPALGDVRLSYVHRRDVQDLADRLTAEGLSASTVQNTLDPLRVIFRRAIRREEGVAVDPTEGLELRRPNGRRSRIASPEEARELLLALPDEDRCLWAAAFFAGLRRGELMALRWSDVVWADRLISVARGWDAIEGEQATKTTAGTRRVPILNQLARELIAHKLRSGRDRGDLVFGATAEKPFAPESVRRRALAAWGAENDQRRERADKTDQAVALVPITLHEARHTCASLLIAAGVNAKAVSAVMGHATITMTFDTYGHLMPGGLDEAAAAANAYLARSRGDGPVLRAVRQ